MRASPLRHATGTILTFAVAETAPATAQIRKVALGHALLSYLFGTGILAVAINLVTNLAQS